MANWRLMASGHGRTRASQLTQPRACGNARQRKELPMLIKQRRVALWNSVFLALAVMCAIGLTSMVKASGANLVMMIQNAQAQPIEVLEGLDPVMLVQGKEAQGNLKISV